jgi:hypothetical protein
VKFAKKTEIKAKITYKGKMQMKIKKPSAMPTVVDGFIKLYRLIVGDGKVKVKYPSDVK